MQISENVGAPQIVCKGDDLNGRINAVAGLRVKDISFWKEELLKEVHNMSEETSNLEVKYCLVTEIFLLTNTGWPKTVSQ